MSTKYDKATKLWMNSDTKPLSELRSSEGQWIWKKLLAHGNKVAQVLHITASTEFDRQFSSKFITINGKVANSFSYSTFFFRSNMQINDDTGKQITFSEMRLKAIRAAQNLLNRGFKPRQKFCFFTFECDYVLTIILAAFGLACPIVPLCPILSKEELVRILTKLQPPVIFCDSEFYTLLNDVLNELRFDIKVFIFEDHVDGVEHVDSLFVETGEENTFT